MEPRRTIYVSELPIRLASSRNTAQGYPAPKKDSISLPRLLIFDMRASIRVYSRLYFCSVDQSADPPLSLDYCILVLMKPFLAGLGVHG